MSHTREPWYIAECDRQRIESFDGLQSTLIADLSTSDFYAEQSVANARRIVACVNACEGIDTEALENTKSLNEYYNQIIRERDVSGSKVILAEQQRDDLQALCRELVEAANKLVSKLKCGDVPDWAYEYVNEFDQAISKTEGKL